MIGGGFWGWLRGLFGSPPQPPAVREAQSSLRVGWFEAMLAETEFVQRYPHYAGIVARMDPVATTIVDTMAVGLRRWNDPTSRLRLLVNTRYFSEHPELRSAILLHEIAHVLLGHLTDARFHAVGHPRLMELAMELTADEMVPEPLPARGLEMADFARFGVAPGQSTMERYRLLSAAYDRGDLRVEDWWSACMRDTHRPRRVGDACAAGLGDLLDARSDGA
ncbi:MAG: hypothetical protein R3A52_33040, partial [Polyangiales bacterium]